MPNELSAASAGWLCLMFAVASMTGLAILLRSRRDITLRSVTGLMLSRGLLGLGTGLVWMSTFPEQPIWLPLGVAVLIGLSDKTGAKDVLLIFLNSLKTHMNKGNNDE